MASSLTGVGLGSTERVVFVVLLILAAGMALRTVTRRMALVRSGRAPSKSGETTSARVRRLLRYVPGQWCNIQNISLEDVGGVQHLFLFFGAIFFAIYYPVFVILGDGLGASVFLYQSPIARGFVYMTEGFGILILIALSWGIIRRTITRPARLGPDFEAGMFGLITLGGFALMLCFFVLDALRIHLGLMPSAGPVSGVLMAPIQRLTVSPAQMVQMYHGLWWVQASFLIAFVIYVPFSKHQHALFSPLNIFASAPKPNGLIENMNLDRHYDGVANPKDLTQKQLVELYGCTQCGRCQDACPAYATGKPLSPKKVIQELRQWMDDKGGIRAPWEIWKSAPKPLVEDYVLPKESWACTTCMACVEVCPAFISAYDKIVDLRRDAVMVKSKIQPEVATFFREVETFGDTFGRGKAHREDWVIGRDFKRLTEENETDVLFWVGCQSTFNDRNKTGATALFDILGRSETDFAILGKGELCCGDPLRRLGNEYIFQSMARKNIAFLNKLKFKRIVTYCPHCFNMLKHEYPQHGGQFEVLHYTEYLKQLIQDKRLNLKKKASGKVVYHDPCYLARGNGIFRQPREILAAASDTPVLETPNSRTNTFCCGGGGGHMWIGGSSGVRINEQRVRELTAYDVKTVVTSCPYCLVMLEDGAKSLQMETIKCMDLVEYVRELL